MSCEHANSSKDGVFRISYNESTWKMHPISGPEGLKFDMLKLIDLDRDVDLDVLTCEERTINAVFWYENPSK